MISTISVTCCDERLSCYVAYQKDEVLEVNDESDIHRWPLGVTTSKPPLINSVDPTLPTGKVPATVVVNALVVVVAISVVAAVVVGVVVAAEVLSIFTADVVVGVVAMTVINGVVVAAEVVTVVVVAADVVAVDNATIGDVLASLTSLSVKMSTSMPCTRGARIFRRNAIRSPSWSTTVTRT